MAIQPPESDPPTERRLRDFARTLSEKKSRRFAAIEAVQRGNGGIASIVGVLSCSTKTIERGMKELDQLQDAPAADRVRGEKKLESESREKETGSLACKYELRAIRTKKISC